MCFNIMCFEILCFKIKYFIQMCLNQINQYYHRLNTLIQIMLYTAIQYYSIRRTYYWKLSLTSHNFIKTACEKCSKCGNAISVSVTEAVVQINLPKVNPCHLQGLTLDVVNQRILQHTASYPAMESSVDRSMKDLFNL